ncbi:MAG: S46 family peptidase [Cyclobacteriaceae bacterium]|nr:S46 family peptidase [Cyclobacteriaceae bacterium]
MKLISTLFAVTFSATTLFAQVLFDPDTVKPGQFDYGKMWTFDNPPLDYFEQTYNFRPTDEWMEAVRLSTVRLPGCTGSFISPDGLIMTNHHCSRGAAVLSTTPEEAVLEKGYLAETLEQERKLKNFYVDQLREIADITEEVKSLMKGGIAETDAFDKVKNEYAAKEDWKGLTLQVLTFYSGGKYSLYGFKRYSDIRLVFIPEEQLGFFGGDPDNFTYPRYDLDCSFLRAYDENGEPMNTSDNYFKFNPNGIFEDELVFVIGNPGSTGRYRTMAQLNFDKEYFLPVSLAFFRDRINLLHTYNSTAHSDSVENVIFSLSNANKSYGGRLEGLYNGYFMTRKTKLEDMNKQAVLAREGENMWDEIEKNMDKLSAYAAEARFLNPYTNYPINGHVMILIHQLNNYKVALESNDESKIEAAAKDIEKTVAKVNKEVDGTIFGMVLKELRDYSTSNDYVISYLDGASPLEKASWVLDNSSILQGKKLPKSVKSFASSKDPLIEASELFVTKYIEAAGQSRAINQANKALEEKIINAQFAVSGSQSPPDATFSLRIADGRVKGYGYNGTQAPYQTTYFGMYDRYYSNNGQAPWSLPQRWLNPPAGLLKSPLNFVATFDTIGGNSGSPVINKNREVVGLNFDSNLERLPVRSIMYDPNYGRSVGVQMGGIYAALKYIYKADRLLEELDVE